MHPQINPRYPTTSSQTLQLCRMPRSLKFLFSLKQSYTGNKRKDPMHYTDRKVGRGYWNFSNTIFHSRPKIHPKTSKGIKLNFYLIIILSLGLCIDYDWYVISILVNKLVVTFVSVDCLLLFTKIKSCKFKKDIHSFFAFSLMTIILFLFKMMLFAKLDEDSLINFSSYLFLVIILFSKSENLFHSRFVYVMYLFLLRDFDISWFIPVGFRYNFFFLYP
ncbi:unnamed protein product [Brugia timori]|uniref:Uncharacterized protein n=1 Tax=Brugia timori TaxID=42155 RepID=A0A0R3R6B2_9BILA|nr:unnamed protein product [Brugia timori]